MTIDMTQFYPVFFEESAEHLASMESLLLGLDIERPDSEDLNAIFRAAHSIKGSSGTFGFTDLSQVTHILESLLDRLRKHEMPLSSAMLSVFLEAGDLLKSMLAGHQGGVGADPQAIAVMCSRLNALAAGPAAPAAAPAPAVEVPALRSLPEHGVAMRRSYDIEFVSTAHAAADPAIIPGLLDELRAYGELSVINRPAADHDTPGFWHLRLSTDQSVEQFGESIDFISERDAWRIKEAPSDRQDDVDGVFGLFDDAPDTPSADECFGLFADAPAAKKSFFTAEADFAAEADTGDAYGFFEPAAVPGTPGPAVVGEADGDGECYGFFAPLPEITPVQPAPAVMPPARVSPVVAALPAEASSIRVGVDKVDQLVNLVGELVITQSMLLQCAGLMRGAAPERLLQGLEQLERNTRDLQASVMSIRMLPISFVFSRFPRVVHDLSSKLGKQVELKLSGEATELDKGLIEKIADPLTHLVRNSLDHGIEMPDVRLAAGKRAVGTITLRAAHQSGNIVIEVGDDGAGLSRSKILAKARERGLAVSDQMSDPEVWMLIFEAGFSTAEVVTDVSGRGVGMDVVRRNIQGMGGRVDIESMLGIGTRMTVRLPLTLAILDGMSVAVGSQTYIVPLSYVVESLLPDLQDIKTLANQTRLVRVRGEYLPVIVLHELFGIKPASADFSQGMMLVLDADGAKVVLFVDALVGQHQVVIKSLENNFRRVAGISGATIMGDGHVALILDIAALAAMARAAQMAAA
jgi:two-component system chemotaxis sensor kinase CheA